MKFLFIAFLSAISFNVYGGGFCQDSAFGDPYILDDHLLTAEANLPLISFGQLRGEKAFIRLKFSEMKVWELYIECLKQEEDSSPEEIQNAERHLDRLKGELSALPQYPQAVLPVDPKLKADPLIK